MSGNVSVDSSSIDVLHALMLFRLAAATKTRRELAALRVVRTDSDACKTLSSSKCPLDQGLEEGRAAVDDKAQRWAGWRPGDIVLKTVSRQNGQILYFKWLVVLVNTVND